MVYSIAALNPTGPSGGLYASEIFQHGRGQATVFIPTKEPVKPIGRVVQLLIPEAELAIARAKASEDSALIAQQKLRIAKLERQIYGQRSERSSRLIEQLALTFEELEADATEDELAAEQAVAKTTTVRGFTRKRAERQTFPEHHRANEW